MNEARPTILTADEYKQILESRIPFVTVTVCDVLGSAPCRPGSKMAVTAADIRGTIGGGRLESEAVRRAKTMLSAGNSVADIQKISLGASLGQCCGGRVSLLFEPFHIPQGRIALFGSGHIGSELIRMISDLPFMLNVYDSRAEMLPQDYAANIRPAVSDDPAGDLADCLSEVQAVVIMTHDHSLDFELVYTALHNDFTGFLGLIGSAAKRTRFEKLLSGRGISPEKLSGLTCPIGVEGITGKHPKLIALSVAAQLAAVLGAQKMPEPS